MPTSPAATIPAPIDISEADIISAMKEIEGYIDISPGDFREIFLIAHKQALQRISNSVRAQDIMTSPVFCLRDDMDLLEASTFLAERCFTGAPVVDSQGNITGVLSEKDFLSSMGLQQPVTFMHIIAHCLGNKGCMTMKLRNHCVAEIMTAPAITAHPETTLGAISTLFVEKKINRLPIVSPLLQPLGIVTRTDLINFFNRSSQGYQS